MKEGFIKLSRAVLSWRHYRDGGMLRVLLHLLLTAAWRSEENGTVPLQKGQVFTSTRKLAAELGISRRAAECKLARLEKCREIVREPGSRGTLITLVNWGFFVCDPPQNEAPRVPQAVPSAVTQPPQNGDTTLYKVDKKEDFQEEKELFSPAEAREKIKKVVEELNRLSGKHFRCESASTVKLLTALFRTGFREEEVLTVVRQACECWRGTHYERHLTPANLFGERFEAFLNGGLFRPDGTAAQKQTAAHAYDARPTTAYSAVFDHRFDEEE